MSSTCRLSRLITSLERGRVSSGRDGLLKSLLVVLALIMRHKLKFLDLDFDFLLAGFLSRTLPRSTVNARRVDRCTGQVVDLGPNDTGQHIPKHFG